VKKRSLVWLAWIVFLCIQLCGAGQGATVAAAEESVEQIKAVVARLRGLDFTGEVNVGTKTREELETFVIEKMSTIMTEDEFEGYATALKMFGLVPSDMNMKEVIVKLLTEQIAGFYDADTKTLYVMSDLAPMADMTTAHELVHALQDQHFDLSTLPMETTSNDDLALGLSSLIEGDAMVVTIAYQVEVAGLPSEVAEGMERFMVQALAGMGGASLPDLPPVLVEGLLFPYTRGLEFCRTHMKGADWDALVPIYHDPPLSSEQILHPEKYAPERDDPVALELPDLSETLGPGWEHWVSNVVGELGVSILFNQFLAPRQIVGAAEGWDGDTYAVYRNMAGPERCLAWYTTWDSPDDAHEFFRVLGKMVTYRFPKAEETRSSDTLRQWSVPGQDPVRAEVRSAGGASVFEMDGAEKLAYAEMWGSDVVFVLGPEGLDVEALVAKLRETEKSAYDLEALREAIRIRKEAVESKAEASNEEEAEAVLQAEDTQ